MEFLRKLKKLASGHVEQEDHPPPLPRRRHRRREQAASPMMDYGPLPRSFFNAVNSARENSGYDALPVFPGGPIPNGDEPHLYEEPTDDVRAFDRSRSKSRERTFDRAARHHSRGTPVKFRRRPVSPELLRARTSSPFVFRQHSLPASPDMHRHFQQLPRQPQFDMRMAQPVQFFPQFQQPFYPGMYPNVHMQQPWVMMRQPQMYPFF